MRTPDTRFDDGDSEDDQLIGKPHRTKADDDDEIEDREQGVAHRVNPLPMREEEEEELSEADIMEELDEDGLDKIKGPDA